MSLLDSLRRGIDNYPGGRTSLRPRVDPSKSDEVFRKELSGATSHKLGAVDALAAAVMCCEAGTDHCYDYPAHVARECGGEFRVLSGDREQVTNPIHRISGLVRETSDVTSIVIDAMGDGVISDNEMAVIEREISEAEEALRKLRQAARAVNAAGKPKADHLALPVRDAMRNEPVPEPEPTVVESVTTSLYSDGTRLESRMTAKGIA